MKYGRVEVTGGFILLMAWLNYLDRQYLLPLALAACICHESGHYIVIRLLGNHVTCIRLSAAGASMAMLYPLGYRAEILAAGAGPAANLILAAICSHYQFLKTFSGMNLILALFNLVPAGQLDGGRILSCILSLTVGPYHADFIKRVLDHVLIALISVLGISLFLFCGNSSMLLVALWLNIGQFSRKKRELGLANKNRNG